MAQNLLSVVYLPTLTTAANAHGLDPWLVEAVAWIESRGQADCFNYEPRYWERYHLAVHPEYRDQPPRRVSSRYGLLQLLYPTAKDLGYQGEPEGLFLPKTNLLYGCQRLKYLTDWAGRYHASRDQQRLSLLSAYRTGTGGNQPGGQLVPDGARYAERVLAAYRTITEAEPLVTREPG